jgi:hypothetical protein
MLLLKFLHLLYKKTLATVPATPVTRSTVCRSPCRITTPLISTHWRLAGRQDCRLVTIGSAGYRQWVIRTREGWKLGRGFLALGCKCSLYIKCNLNIFWIVKKFKKNIACTSLQPVHASGCLFKKERKEERKEFQSTHTCMFNVHSTFIYLCTLLLLLDIIELN